MRLQSHNWLSKLYKYVALLQCYNSYTMFKVGETNIICTNLERSRTFYETILGFKFVEEDQGAVRLKCDNQYFLLLPFATQKRKEAEYCSIAEVSFDLRTDKLQETYAYLVSKDVYIASEPNEVSFHICDPDGLYIEIVYSPY